MRTLTPLLAAVLLVGCAAQPLVTRAPAPAPAPAVAAVPVAVASGASSPALAFDPPGTTHATVPDLSRAPRAASAANGVVESSSTQFNVTTSIQDTSASGDFTQSTVTQQAGTVRH